MSDYTTCTVAESLPACGHLKQVLQAAAMMDCMLCQSIGEPVYAFNCKWAGKRSIASVKNGLGDDLFIVFEGQDCFLKGSAHDYLSRIRCRVNLRELVPNACQKYLQEPAFECENATLFAWTDVDGMKWRSTSSMVGDINDGSEYLLGFIRLQPEDFHKWAVENYEVELSLELVKSVYNHTALKDDFILAVNADLNVKGVRNCAAHIGYPQC